MARAHISVVIPTLNGGALFARALDQILAQSTSFRFDVTVIDSGSTDGTVAMAQARGVRLLTTTRREFNHGATRDAAIASTEGELIALTVQDAEPSDQHWLAAFARAFAEVPDAAGVYSRQIPRPGLNPILRERLLAWSATRTVRGVQRLPPGQALSDLAPLDRLKLVAFDNVSSCIRRRCWQERPFGRRAFGEDLRWATHWIERGQAIVFEPTSAVIHSHDSSVGYEFRRIYADHQNLSELLGLVTVPDLRALFRNAAAAHAHYKEVLMKEPLAGPEFARLLDWSRRYAFAENLAQYLGAKSSLVDRSRAPWRIIDRWLRRGV
ncbi:MAG: glycosyltransferase [Planctomycetota bacterium]